MQGILLVDKPAGWTSFDVVNYVRRIVATAEGKKPKNCKVGHTGTLDPFATGLLVLLIGKEYTRQAQSLSKADKTYEVIMQLGTTSTTGDPEGELSIVSGVVPTKAALQEVLEQFRGQITQIPPIYSAIKVNGQRAYALARAGQAVAMVPRPATIHRLEVSDYTYPLIAYSADVGSGTYLRTLSEDIATALGSCAYTIALRRTRVGRFTVADACQVDGLNPEKILERLLV
ncbi:MAG: tRNA pseudouridine(55) synthase TruB [Candidatus Saccharibacteria bacterium]